MLAAVTAGAASAQPKIQMGPPPGTSNDAPPVAVGPGWRYERRPPDIHMFLCQQDELRPLIARQLPRLAPDKKFDAGAVPRRAQEAVVKALEQRAPPGTRIEILGDRRRRGRQAAAHVQEPARR